MRVYLVIIEGDQTGREIIAFAVEESARSFFEGRVNSVCEELEITSEDHMETGYFEAEFYSISVEGVDVI